jgi:hypothetical protein
MKYFAKLGLSSKVITVLSVADKIATTEQAGIDYLTKLFNYPFWVQCSKKGSIRKNGAGKGYTYDDDRDAFIPPQPYNSWTLNEDTCRWEAPSAYPDDGKMYEWNEETTSWDEVTI